MWGEAVRTNDHVTEPTQYLQKTLPDDFSKHLVHLSKSFECTSRGVLHQKRHGDGTVQNNSTSHIGNKNGTLI